MSYLRDGEQVLEKTKAVEGHDPAADSGILVCTPNRVVFGQKGSITDVSVGAVNSIEYENEGYPTGAAASFCLLAAFLFGIGATPFFISEAPEFLRMLIPGGAVLALIGAVIMFYYRHDTLTIQTPNKAYTYTSRSSDLDRIARTIRNRV